MTIAGLENPIPFALQPQLSVAADGSRFVVLTVDQASRDGGTYTVTLFLANGDTILNRSYTFCGTPIPQNAIDSAIAAMAPRPGSRNEGPSNLPARFQALARKRIPPVYSPVQRIRLGLDSTLWIDLRPTSEGQQLTLVLNDRGDSLGTVIVPLRSRIQQASKSHVWVTETDEYGLASIVRYRVTGLALSQR